MKTHYEPKGFRFMDGHLGEALFVQEGDFTGWICKRHPDGQWATVRFATKEDLDKITERIAIGN